MEYIIDNKFKTEDETKIKEIVRKLTEEIIKESLEKREDI